MGSTRLPRRRGPKSNDQGGFSREGWKYAKYRDLTSGGIGIGSLKKAHKAILNNVSIFLCHNEIDHEGSTSF